MSHYDEPRPIAQRGRVARMPSPTRSGPTAHRTTGGSPGHRPAAEPSHLAHFTRQAQLAVSLLTSVLASREDANLDSDAVAAVLPVLRHLVQAGERVGMAESS
jgi:hypothetical protein